MKVTFAVVILFVTMNDIDGVCDGDDIVRLTLRCWKIEHEHTIQALSLKRYASDRSNFF